MCANDKQEDRKQSLKKKRKRSSEPARTDDADSDAPKKNTKKDGKFKPKKRVSFG